MNQIKALSNSILFQFTDDSSGGFFGSKLSQTIMIARDSMENQSGPRWGKVISAGPKVTPEIQEGKFILVESLKWTKGMRLDQEDISSEVWKTNDKHVLAISDEPVSAF